MDRHESKAAELRLMSMKSLSCVVLVVVASMASGACAASGRQFDTTRARDVRLGQDKASVRTWFGEPLTLSTFAVDPHGCVERWQYTHATPMGVGRAHSQILVVDFDARGVVCHATYTETNP